MVPAEERRLSMTVVWGAGIGIGWSHFQVVSHAVLAVGYPSAAWSPHRDQGQSPVRSFTGIYLLTTSD